MHRLSALQLLVPALALAAGVPRASAASQGARSPSRGAHAHGAAQQIACGLCTRVVPDLLRTVLGRQRPDTFGPKGARPGRTPRGGSAPGPVDYAPLQLSACPLRSQSGTVSLGPRSTTVYKQLLLLFNLFCPQQSCVAGAANSWRGPGVFAVSEACRRAVAAGFALKARYGASDMLDVVQSLCHFEGG